MLKIYNTTSSNIFSLSFFKIFIPLFLLFVGTRSVAATITSAGTGLWGAGGTWVGGVAPSSTDNVIIATSHVITVNGIYTCANLTIGSSGLSPTVKITAAANSLTITGLLTMNSGNFGGTYTLDAGPGTININGTISWASTSGTNLIETTSTGTVNIAPAITISSATQSMKVTTSGGSIRFSNNVIDQQNKISVVAGGNVYFNGSYTVNTTATTLWNATSNAYFTGTGKAIVSTVAITLGNVFMNAGASATLSGAGLFTVGGSFTLNAGALLTLNSDMYVKQNWTNNGGTLSGGSYHVYLTASNSTVRAIGGSSATAFPNLHIGKPAGTWAVKYTLSVNITCSSLTLESNGGNTSSLTHSGAYSLNVSGNVTINQLTVNAPNTWYINTGSSIVSGNLTFTGTSNTTSRIAQIVVTTGSFSLAGTTTWMANTAIVTEVISVTTGSLTFGTSLAMPVGAGALKVTGTGTINFNGAAPSYSLNGAGSGATLSTFTTTAGCYLNFANGLTNNNTALVIKNGSYSVFTATSTVTPTAAITFGNITINAAATLALAGNITVTNDWLNSGGTFTPGTNTVTFTPIANATQNITKTGGETFYTLTATLASATLKFNSDVTITNTLNMSGHTFNLNGYVLTLGSGSASTLTIAGITTTKGFAYGGTFKRYWAASTAVTATGAPYNGLFPIGILGDYRPVKIASTVSPTGGGYVSATHTDAIDVTDISYVDNQGVTITRISDQFSSVRVTGVTGGTYNIDVTFNGFSNPGSAAYSDYRLITYTGSVLGSAGSNLVPVANTILNPVVRRTGLTSTNLNNDFVCGTINSTNTPIQPVYFSRTGAATPMNLNWNATTTWSTTGSAGPSCTCTPSSTAYVIISSGTLVHVNAVSSVDKVEVKNGGKLDGTANLTTSTFLSAAGTGLIAPTTGTWSIGSNMLLNGSGASTSGAIITIAGDLSINGTATLTMTAALTVSNDLVLNSTLAMGSNAVTLNGSGASISGTGSVTGSNSILITNDKVIGVGSNLTIAPTFAISNNVTVVNDGTVTFSGNVTGGNANSQWTNQSNAVLNVAGTLMTTGKLDASDIPNTVNYNGSGAQTIKVPVSDYHGLTCSNAGTKTMGGSFAVDDNLTLTGSVILDESTNVLSGTGDLIMISGTPELKIQRAVNTSSPELTGSYNLTTGTVTIHQTSNTNTVHDATYYNLKFTGTASYDMGNVDVISHDFSLSGSSIWTNTTGNTLFISDSLIYSSSGSSTLTGDVNTAIFKATAGTLADGGNIVTITSGDWIRNGGTYTATGEVKFTSSTTQNISGSSSTSFFDLTVDNSSFIGVNLTKATTVNGTLTLTNGLINTTSTNLLTLSNGAITSVGSSISYVNGPMAYVMANLGTSMLNFPIGKAGQWRPVVVTPIHTTATPYTYTSELLNASAKALNWTLPATINRVSDIRYWDINRSAVSTDLTSATVTLYYGTGNGTNDGVTDFANLTVAKAPVAGTAWSDALGTASGNSTGTITSGPITSFSRFTLGNKTAGTNPLPIELLSFNATPMGKIVNLTWSTGSEKNNDYFTIEKTKDGSIYKEVMQLKGAGNSNSILNYRSQDDSPYSGISYYRLKQTDFDGHVSYSNLQKVDFEGSNEFSFEVYPNPADGNVIHLTFNSNQRLDVKIEIQDLMGQVVYSTLQTIDENNYTHTIHIADRLASGIYLISTTSSNGQKIAGRRIIVK